MALKKSELYSSLWAGCDELRGGMDASQYKDYVLVLLFVKYVSDKYAGQPYAAITVPPGASFADLVALKGTKNIGDDINKRILGPLFLANHLSDPPDFNDPAKLGSGKEMVDRLTSLVAIFEDPNLDFSRNRADGDDLLGDAYEYLMRHFATESGKSKGQFYTPAEVSRIIAHILGIRHAVTSNDTTVYDPTCGSGSLLLKIGDAARHGGKDVKVTLYGQEKDNATAGLARMNMILHDYATAEIKQGNTLASPLFLDGDALKTFDYVVANPPFSDKRWSTGLLPDADPFQRFHGYGVPPAKQGDYAYLLHILRSLKSTGKGACILPHGVLFRGNAEAVIRRNLIQRGVIKAIIGLPANLFYGTGIPACILVLDKENAQARKGIFMVDASKGFKKDGPKNRLREQDLHKIVDTFTRQDESDPRYARMVPVAEIADPKNDYNLNLPRYIDSTEPEDLQDIDAHLRGGIPERDLDALGHYWKIMPGVRAALFSPSPRLRGEGRGEGRLGYSDLAIPIAEVKPAIFAHPEFTAFTTQARKLFTKWQTASVPLLKGLAKDGHPKPLIETIAEDLLTTFKTAPLLDAYDVYQHLMDYWAETMQDDCYLVADAGWIAGARPREIVQVKNKEGKLIWPEKEDFKKGKRRFKSDLVPAALLIARYFTAERDAIAALEAELASIEQQLDETREEQNNEGELLLADANEASDGEPPKVTAKSVKAALKKIGKDKDYAEERQALGAYAALLDQQADTKTRLKTAQDDLEAKLDAKYPTLTEADIQTLVVDDKWLATLAAAVQGELDRVSQTLTGRIRQLAERYATPLPQLTDEVAALAAKVDQHLQKMGAVWK
jgi:type I restriction enzyme M protein